MGNASSYPATLPYTYLQSKSEPSSVPAALLGNAFLQLNAHQLIVFGGGVKDSVIEELSDAEESQKRAVINKAHVFDIRNQTWKQYDIGGEAPINRGNFVAAVIEATSPSNSINIVIFGGSNEFHGWLDDVHLLTVKIDLASTTIQSFAWETVTTTGSLPSPRDKASSFIYQNYLFVFGGFGPVELKGSRSHVSNACSEKAEDESDDEDGGDMAEFTWFNDMYCLDLTSFKWSKVIVDGTAPTPRAATAIAFFSETATGYLYGGRDVTARQNDLKKFVISNNNAEFKAVWSGVLLLTPTLPTGRSFHSLLPISASQLLLISGMNTEDNPKNDIMVFDIEFGAWFTLSTEAIADTLQDLINFKPVAMTVPTSASAPTSSTPSSIKPLGTDKAVYEVKNNVVFVFGEYLDSVILALSTKLITSADKSSLQHLKGK